MDLSCRDTPVFCTPVKDSSLVRDPKGRSHHERRPLIHCHHFPHAYSLSYFSKVGHLSTLQLCPQAPSLLMFPVGTGGTQGLLFHNSASRKTRPGQNLPRCAVDTSWFHHSINEDPEFLVVSSSPAFGVMSLCFSWRGALSQHSVSRNSDKHCRICQILSTEWNCRILYACKKNTKCITVFVFSVQTAFHLSIQILPLVYIENANCFFYTRFLRA